MYRDDACAVCGESLPPDHFYCREHAAEVDERLHELGVTMGRLVEDLPRVAVLLDQVAPETWDWLTEQAEQDHDPGDDVLWPVTPHVALRVHADEVDVDVDTEPGQVRLELVTDAQRLLAAVAAGLQDAGAGAMARACREASGANTTH